LEKEMDPVKEAWTIQMEEDSSEKGNEPDERTSKAQLSLFLQCCYS